ncbi:condensation domain-containing protein [Bradyrhizobium sp. CCBAU 53421]|uniref:condensation domain-containing protein n=1 Tax=Bradyrhizobium sp. CCBAU 53421 TaxID=1325120 RepID=UPI001FF00C72|nr:condensation domain-containing protein [Bradyrhizobium sp. CCBAU 53421]
MDIKEFGDLDRQPGRLMVWRINVPEPISWRADPRRPSYVQEEHLRSADDGRPGWLGAAFELPGELHAAALTKAILGWVDRHEVLRSRLAKDGSAMHRATIDPGAAALEQTVVSDCADSGETAQLLEKLFDAETNALRWPAYVFVTISRPTSTSLLLAADHSVSDAYSMALVPYEIRELYTAAIRRVEPQLAAVHSYLDHAEAERERLTDLTDDHPAIGHWRELIAANGGQLPHFPLSFDAPERSLQRSGKMWLLDAAGACEFDRGCRSQGGNAATGIFASLALAGKTLANQRQIPRRCALSHQVRSTIDAFGWMVCRDEPGELPGGRYVAGNPARRPARTQTRQENGSGAIFKGHGAAWHHAARPFHGILY